MFKKNIAFSTATAFFQLYNGSVILILLIKILDIHEFGEVAFGISLSGIISTFGEFGFSLMAIRDIPQKKFKLSSYVYNVLSQKTILNIIVLIFGFIYLFLFYKNQVNFNVKLVFLINGIILSFCGYFTALLQSINKFKSETRAVFITSILLTILVFSLTKFTMPLIYFSFFFILINFIKLILLIYSSQKMLFLKTQKIEKNIQIYLSKNAWSFGLHFIMGVLYFSIDAQIIYKILGNEQLAIYNSAFRIASISLIFTNILMQVFQPYLASIILEKRQKFDKLVILLLNSFLFIICSFSVIVLLFNKTLILFLYKKQYLSASFLLLPLLIMCILRGIALVYGMLLTLSDNQLYRVKAIFISLVINVVSNFFLIPIFGIKGAAFSTLITHLVLAGAYIYIVQKQNSFFYVNKYSFFILIFTLVSILLIFIINNVLITSLLLLLFSIAISGLFHKNIKIALDVFLKSKSLETLI